MKGTILTYAKKLGIGIGIGGQGGNIDLLLHPEKLPTAPLSIDILSDTDGYISSMDAERVGEASLLLGAGRETKEDVLDMGAGVILHKKTGDRVAHRERIATLYASDKARLDKAKECFLSALSYADIAPAMQPLIYKTVF